MAKDIIARLKLDNSNYDSNARKAQQTTKALQGQFNNLNSVLSQFGGNLGGLGGKIGSLSQSILGMSGNMTSLIGASAGVTAGIAAVGAAAVAATAELIKYNEELGKQNQRVQVVTGLSGGDADNMRNQINGMVQAYNVDFNSAVSTANTMMNKLGLTSEEAISVMRDGLQGMTEGDAPKFLQLMDQFGPAFRDMGLSASETAAVIHESLGGAFGEDGMAAVQMAGKRIREMGTQAQAALQGIGIDAQKMQQDIQSGNITIVQAIQQVAGGISKTGINSKAAGEAMSAVFGRQGANLGEAQIAAIANLNTNLQETKTRTGEIGAMNDKLATSQARLNELVAEFFGSDDMATMSQEWKAFYTDCLVKMMEGLGEWKDTWELVKQAGMDCVEVMKDSLGDVIGIISDCIEIVGVFGDGGTSAFNVVGEAATVATAPLKILREILDWIVVGVKAVRDKFVEWKNDMASGINTKWLDDLKNGLNTFIEKIKTAIKWYNDLKKALGVGGKGTEGSKPKTADSKAGYNAKMQSSNVGIQDARYTGAGSGKGSTTNTEKTRIQEINAEIQKLEKEYISADETTRKTIADKIHWLDVEKQGLQSLAKAAHDAPQEMTYQLGKALNGETYVITKPPVFDEAAAKEFAKEVQDMLNDPNIQASAQVNSIVNGSKSIGDQYREKTPQTFDEVVSQYDQLQAKIKEFQQNPLITQSVIDDAKAKLAQLGVSVDELGQKYKQALNMKKIADNANAAAEAFGTMGSALQQIEDPSVKVAGIVMEAIANIASSFAKALLDIKNPWEWIAAAASGTAVMVSTIAAIKSATAYNAGSYAEGGWVGGSSGGFVGDSVPAFLNRGEYVMTQDDVRTANSNLEAAYAGGGGGNSYISGEQIVTVVRNYGKRTGHGEWLR